MCYWNIFIQSTIKAKKSILIPLLLVLPLAAAKNKFQCIQATSRLISTVAGDGTKTVICLF